MNFGLIFFSSSEAPPEDKYRLLMESARFADRHGFASVWIPERHFTRDGWLYPSPAVLLAAVARETRRIGLRAGSVVLPLHDPIRVAEEWSVVDNLSGGRVGVSFASGWHPTDFAFFPDRYATRHDEMWRGIDIVEKLWRGESVEATAGDGRTVSIRTFPPPVQPRLPVWITAAGNPKTFEAAGEHGAHLLTHLFNQGLDQLAANLRLYRAARERAGFDPAAGIVTVMMHTFVSDGDPALAAHIRSRFCDYMKSASYLLDAIAQSRGTPVDLSQLSEQDIDEYVAFVFDRLVGERRVLFGTPESCQGIVEDLRAVGVHEIACQTDFGVDTDTTLASLPHLHALTERCTPNVRDDEAAGLTAAKTRCDTRVEVADFYGQLHTRGVQLDSRFRGVRSLAVGNGEALGEVWLPEALEDQAGSYGIHPALLDACFQVLIAAVPDAFRESDALYLPVGLRRFESVAPIPRRIWSHATLDPDSDPSTGTLNGTLQLYDEAGRLVATARGLRLARMDHQEERPQRKAEEWEYDLRWELLADGLRSGTPPGASARDWWLVFADGHGVAAALAIELEGMGSRCVRVEAATEYERRDANSFGVDPRRAQDFQRLCADLDVAGAPPRAIVHLWSLDITCDERSSTARLMEQQAIGCGSVVPLVQSLAGQPHRHLPRVWLVTRGAQAVTPGDAVAVGQAPLWGIGRALAHEHPDLWGGLLDLDPAGAAISAAQQLIAALTATVDENEIACRGNGVHVARLVRRLRDGSNLHAAGPISGEGCYVITGGGGDLGLQVAKWLVRQGARHLALCGRSPLLPDDRRHDVLRELERDGAAVHYAVVDVSDETAVRAFREWYEGSHHIPIRGVFHLAAAVHGATIANLEPSAFDAVLRPKAAGAWALHRVFADAPLDLFVLFSAIPALIGPLGAGAANYASANALLDALAHYRRARGLPALSIGWGPWADTGMAARTEGGIERLAAQGVGAVPPEQALEVLGRLLVHPTAYTAVVKIDWARFAERTGAHAVPLLRHLAPGRRHDDGPAERRGFLDALLAADGLRRHELLLAHLRERAASVLGLAPSDLDVARALNDLGVDSLMAIELKNRVERDVGVRLPMFMILEGPSVAKLTGEVLKLVAASEASSAPSAPAAAFSQSVSMTPKEAARLLEQVDGLSELEVDALLDSLSREARR